MRQDMTPSRDSIVKAKQAVIDMRADMKAFLNATMSRPEVSTDIRQMRNDAAPQSVRAIAQSLGYTLHDWVTINPLLALASAENYAEYWRSVQRDSLIKGTLFDNSINAVNVALLNNLVDAAEKDIGEVFAICETAGIAGEKRKEHLVRVLYNKATAKGDMQSIKYLMDKVEEMEQKSDGSNAYLVMKIVNSFFDKQLQVMNSGYGTRMLMCSRRAGKTRLLCGIMLIEALSTTNVTCMYIGETMTLSESLVDTGMNEIIDECDLKDKDGNRLNWKRLDNGSKIMIRGLSNTKDPDQIRGFKAKVICIDEFFHLKSNLLQYMLQEVLEPMQVDYANEYRMILAGTPPPYKGTYGDTMWDELDVPKYTWTLFDNPFPVGEDKKAFVAQKLKEKGLDENSAFYLREYMAQRVYDEQILLYPDFVEYDPLTPPTYSIDRVLIGLDYGVGDNDALIAVAWDSTQRRGYVFYESKFNRLTIQPGMTQLQQMKQEAEALWKYSLEFFPHIPKKEANKCIIWQADDNNQHITQELKVNVHVEDLAMNIGNAHKTDGVMIRDKIRDALRTGALLLPENGPTVDECLSTTLKRDELGNLTPEIDGRKYHPDLLPALRYAMWYAVGKEVEPYEFRGDNSTTIANPFTDEMLKAQRNWDGLRTS